MAKASTPVVFAVVSFYVLVSVSTTLMNKLSFPRDTFPFPFTVTCFQMAVALMWLMVLTVLQAVGPGFICSFLGLSRTKSLDWNPLHMWNAVGCAGAFTGMLATGNLCLMFVQVSFYQAAKSQHILFSLILSSLLLGTTAAPNIIMACAGVTVGFIINAMAEVDIMRSLVNDSLASLTWGMAAGLVSSFFVALYPLLLKRSMVSMDNWQISINVNLMSLLWFAPLIGYEIHQGKMLDNPVLYDRAFWAFNFATATVGFVLNLASMMQVRVTSPLTHMVVGAFKGAVTTCLGVVMYGNKMNLTSTVGVTILISCSFFYSYLKWHHTQSETSLKEKGEGDKDK
uniref:Sugar phosphate transporter domain-containing protein n=1 Tax=Hemiselmis andersenii TaxID=464988 RepID=A0A6U4TTN3_HEMAN|mmetsp:Transcript_9149/g.21346  ORF Transcript_9149/g.21346 Transcript_9149/m.21346 type:complete len:341 (+) Transcript_9149:67-1089(+)|eukprot:CAMPEP_0114167108 /NCGR_PEP_ID=MMETSP0043_2-20121206/32218_1 /TAXON_ID=464988 /ORGANISM="Hemiselmis andersenii, Strain CCMP644" /LENGTH=340 /DNA_ID=CAMNT_0001264199 /DNA_START=66 /DNA_END=1088 /DNA_ORIENTATION=-